MRKRNQRVEVYLSKAELDTLNKKVSRTGLSREGYIRTLINGNTPKELPPMDFYDVLKELRQISNNMNQIAAKANSTGFVEAERYISYAEDLQLAINKIMGKVFS